MAHDEITLAKYTADAAQTAWRNDTFVSENNLEPQLYTWRQTSAFALVPLDHFLQFLSSVAWKKLKHIIPRPLNKRIPCFLGKLEFHGIKINIGMKKLKQ